MEFESSSNGSVREESTSSPARQSRLGGRGRGRPPGRRGRGSGRGRPRGSARRGRGRGQHRVGGATRADVALQSLQERDALLEKRIDDLSTEDAKSLLKATVKRHPSLVLDLLECQSAQPGGGYHPPAGGTTPSWCVCTRCREMPKQEERLCCGKHPTNCISQLPDFSVLILEEAVLALSRMYRNEVLVLPEEDDWCKANRHAAYRQFIMWQHGRLGAGNRRVIPSCCIWRIRDKYPDPFGQYTGFIVSRFT